LVQALIQGAENESDVAVADELLDRCDALRRTEQADRGDVLRATIEEELDRRTQGTAGGEHRVDGEALPIAQVVGQTLGVRGRLERRLVANHAEEADLGGGDELDEAFQHSET